MQTWLRSTPGGAYVAAGAQVVAIIIAAFSFAGPPPLEGPSVVSLTWPTVYWIAAMWLVSLIGMAQAFYSLDRSRRGAEATRQAAVEELEKKRSNQVLSDLMSDQWEFAVHNLLNKPPASNGTDLSQWRERVRDWERRTVEIMREHHCTKQDIRSVDIIGLAPWIQGLHPHPASCHALSMLVAQMNRVADVARKYGD